MGHPGLTAFILGVTGRQICEHVILSLPFFLLNVICSQTVYSGFTKDIRIKYQQECVFPVCPFFTSEKWWPVYCNPAGWYAARHRVWHEVHLQVHTSTPCITEPIIGAQCFILSFVFINADTCPTWAMSTVILLHVTSWSTVTLCVKCLISACPESWKTTRRLRTPHG